MFALSPFTPILLRDRWHRRDDLLLDVIAQVNVFHQVAHPVPPIPHLVRIFDIDQGLRADQLRSDRWRFQQGPVEQITDRVSPRIELLIQITPTQEEKSDNKPANGTTP